MITKTEVTKRLHEMLVVALYIVCAYNIYGLLPSNDSKIIFWIIHAFMAGMRMFWTFMDKNGA